VESRWAITKTDETGGGWLVNQTTIKASALENVPSVETKALAFTTLDRARNYVAKVTNVDKRVRFTKLSDNEFTYQHKA
jgi:hypothetical protein